MIKRNISKFAGMRIEDTVKSASGLYTVREVSRFAGVHPQTLNYWYFGTTERKPLRQTEIMASEGKFLTFHEFVEALAIRSLRIKKHVPLQKIRAAIKEASAKYGIQYPFSNQTHRTVLVGRDFQIFMEPDALTGLTGKDRAQKSFRPCLETYIERLKYDDTKTACEYIAYRYGDGDKAITMNPKICFGEPMVGKSGYTAETLYGAAFAEGSIDKVAQYYEVDRASVAAACSYWEELNRVESRN